MGGDIGSEVPRFWVQRFKIQGFKVPRFRVQRFRGSVFRPVVGQTNSRSNRKRNFQKQILDFGMRISDLRYSVHFKLIERSEPTPPAADQSTFDIPRSYTWRFMKISHYRFQTLNLEPRTLNH
ncbi:hypothetical protein D1AOALGA4SA_5833 [Olavius algarvensis Delta 1 endosymbiont]|nr:hypothetical protein D1AOALGA4SA_5833 [Olavius algarvensis Delta 1 endosymbiont]